VTGIQLSTSAGTNVTIVGSETVTFTVTYNRDMDITVQAQVSFGPDTPVTDYTVHPINGGWQDPRTWMGTFNANPLTGDGYQLIRIAGGRAADDPWLVCGEDSGRFRFEVITSGTESMNMMAAVGEGHVDLNWMQDDFTLLLGYNLYRSTNPSNNFTRINTTLVPWQTRTFTDTNVAPGVPYYYAFTVVADGQPESAFSSVAQATPTDTIPPVISHTPVSSALPGQNLPLSAVVTDNVGVQAVTLYYRTNGAPSYASIPMTHITGNSYAATIPASALVPPGIQYYIQATDGVTPVYSPPNAPATPYSVTVADRPVISVVTPNSGLASVGTTVTITGSNFKTNAIVSIGGVAASSVTVLSANQITCVTVAHFPAVADVIVTNPDGQSATLLRGFTYVSDVVSLSLPNTGGPPAGIVQVPINAANVQGLVSAGLTVTFDSTVLRARTASAGNLTSGWTVLSGMNTPGQIILALVGGSAANGAGTLAIVEFEVLGSPGANTTLGLTGLSLNGGAVQTQTANSSFAVNPVYNISGTVRYWNGNSGVRGVLATLQGNSTYSGQSGADGTFTVAGAAAGNYSLTLSKSDDVNGITAYDASLVLQDYCHLITLTGSAAVAADVDKSGTIDPMDAYHILQASVGNIALPFPGAGVVWQFDPPSRNYSSLNGSQANQDFTAVLLGDPSGNWVSGGGTGPIVAKDLQSVTVALRSLTTQSNETQVWLLARALDEQVYSIDLRLKHYPSHGLLGLRSGPFAEALTMASNTNEAGVVRVALAGAVPVRGIGALLVLTLPSGMSNDLQIASASVDEGAVQVELDPTGASFDQDTDRDGQPDWAELRGGTDPTDSKSIFAIRSVTVNDDGSKTLTWSSVAGKTYQVWSRDEAAGSQWLRVGGEVTATGDRATLVDRPASEVRKRLYRIQLVE
jgi:hypothetical protein